MYLLSYMCLIKSDHIEIYEPRFNYVTLEKRFSSFKIMNYELN